MHIKYRPKTIDEIIGNEHIKVALSNLKYNRPILFEGDRGCGKTTFASILSKSFLEGQEDNLLEIDAVANSTIDEVRELTKWLKRSSMFGDKKVLLINEIPELSPKAQKDLLVTLEILPQTKTVIATTTEPERLNKALLDRFIRFRVHHLNDSESMHLIKRVCKGEGFSIPKPIIAKLIKSSDGTPRKILTTLPKLINISNEEDIDYLLSLDSIDESEEILTVFKYVINKASWNSIKSLLSQLLKNNKPEQIRIGFINLISTKLLHFDTSEKERDNLLSLYDCIKDYRIPEGANLVINISKYINDKHKT